MKSRLKLLADSNDDSKLYKLFWKSNNGTIIYFVDSAVEAMELADELTTKDLVDTSVEWSMYWIECNY
jgi:hypothetical protein